MINDVVKLALKVVTTKIDSLDRQADIAEGIDVKVFKDLREQEKSLRLAVKTIEFHLGTY